MAFPRTQPRPTRSTSLEGFILRLLIVSIFVLLAAAMWKLADVLVLLFGAVLLAVGLCAAARWVSGRTGIGRGLSLTCVFILVMAVFGAAFWVFGATVAAQFDDVVRVIPAGFKLFTGWVGRYSYGRQLLDQITGQTGGAGSGSMGSANILGAAAWATSMVTAVVGTVTRTLGYAVIALFVAIYLAAQPDRYRRLCLRLVPPRRRLIAEHLFEVSGEVLEDWLVGQVVVMLVIGVLTGLGLWALGIEAAAALGLMGGLLCFIPYVGAVLAAVPATLVALTQGPIYAVSVILMYAGVHFVEGNFITPMVQAEATSFPPVLAILCTVVFSLLLGPVGVLLAAPLTLFLMAVVEVLYVQQILGEAPIGEGPRHAMAGAAPFDTGQAQ
jgi:predicted PurR-regulated permease PerM